MRNWFREIGRSFSSGADLAKGATDVNVDFNLLISRAEDLSYTDEQLVQEVLNFLVKHPEQKTGNNFQSILNKFLDKRPGMVKILMDRLNQK